MISDWLSSIFFPKPVKMSEKPRVNSEQALAPHDGMSITAHRASDMALGSVATLSLLWIRYRFKRLPTHKWITPDIYAQKRRIKGIVTRQVIRCLLKQLCLNLLFSVGDPDGLRLYHTPVSVRYWLRKGIPTTEKGLLKNPWHFCVWRYTIGLANQTISIRLAGIDAPEVGITWMSSTSQLLLVTILTLARKE